jgi:hypothetical protein
LSYNTPEWKKKFEEVASSIPTKVLTQEEFEKQQAERREITAQEFRHKMSLSPDWMRNKHASED